MNEGQKKILTIDDDRATREAVSERLQKEGFNCVSAADGAEGFEKAKTEHPALILLDLMMPNMNGIEMLKKLRAEDWGKDIPVIVLTNVDSVDAISTIFVQGTLDYIVKTDAHLDDIVGRVKEKLGV